MSGSGSVVSGSEPSWTRLNLYIGGPIDGQSTADRQQWVCYAVQRMLLVAALRQNGHQVFAAWERTQPGYQDESHVLAEESALQSCDAMVALLPKGIPTYGTPIEIHRVASSGRPV